MVQAAMPNQPEMSKWIFDTFPSLKSEDMADVVDEMLGAPDHVQMQDLKVTHVLTDSKSMADQEGNPMGKRENEDAQM